MFELLDLGREPFKPALPGTKFEEGIVKLLLAVDSAFGKLTSTLEGSLSQLLTGIVFLPVGLPPHAAAVPDSFVEAGPEPVLV